ncbi:MAG: DUF3078 domain-containing protein [Dysgonamonadaceae bacterium]|jgi:hypothetical protein|nr:DUF3078 domain-containing protein [Dysgonamonadaceae bacterium]
MTKKKKLLKNYITASLSILISLNTFSQNTEINNAAEQDTLKIETATIITIGSEGNENTITQETDTTTTKIEESIENNDVKFDNDTPKTEPKQETVTNDTITNKINPEDLANARKLLNEYHFKPLEINIEYPDTVVLPSLQLPFVYYLDRTPGTIQMPEMSVNPYFIPIEKLMPKQNIFSDKNNKNTVDKKAYIYVVDNYPQYVKYSIADLSGRVEKTTQIEATNLANMFKMEYDINRDFIDKTENYKPKKKYWLWKGTHYISFSQSDNSINWTDTTKTKSEKGMGAVNLVSVQGITGKYKKNRIEINHNMEWRLGIANSMNDSLRSIKIMEDRLRSYTDFGLAAVKHWNYSTTLEITTPLLVNRKENSTDTLSAFLSPIKMTYGLGMQYNITKEYPTTIGKKVVFVAYINPLALQYIFIKSHVLDPANHGIKEPKGNKNLSLLDFGSTVTSTVKVNFNKHVTLDSRLKYFTNYHKSSFESESTLNMPVNRYISMRLYAYLTFDDMRVKNAQFGHFSLNETLGLTFNVTW